MKIFDTSKHLLIQPYKQGVKIIKPDNNNIFLSSIGNIFSLPINAFFINHDSIFVAANHQTLVTNLPGGNHGYFSKKDLIGKKMEDLFKTDTAEKLIHDNNIIMHCKKEMAILEERVLRLDELNFSAISFKFPVYNIEDKIIGILGLSAIIESMRFLNIPPLANTIETIIKTGIFPQANLTSNKLLPGYPINGIYLSAQEIKCLHLLIAGKTIKMIAKILNISPRTVEHYLENIRHKLHANSKSELIEKVIYFLWPDF